jgi:hypothetical protein
MSYTNGDIMRNVQMLNFQTPHAELNHPLRAV